MYKFLLKYGYANMVTLPFLKYLALAAEKRKIHIQKILILNDIAQRIYSEGKEGGGGLLDKSFPSGAVYFTCNTIKGLNR